MCIIIDRPAAVCLGDSVYANCFSGNRDGAGFSYVEDGKIQVKKGFFTLDALMQELRKHDGKHVVVHFRYATHGEKNEFNCHPWVIENCHAGFSFAVSHNGVLDWESSHEMSDTGHFVRDVLEPWLKRDPWALDFEPCRKMLGAWIGDYNKLVVHRSDGVVHIINEEQGEHDLGCWFSNHGYKSFAGFSRRGEACTAGNDEAERLDEWWREHRAEYEDEGLPSANPRRKTLGEMLSLIHI